MPFFPHQLLIVFVFSMILFLGNKFFLKINYIEISLIMNTSIISLIVWHSNKYIVVGAILSIIVAILHFMKRHRKNIEAQIQQFTGEPLTTEELKANKDTQDLAKRAIVYGLLSVAYCAINIIVTLFSRISPVTILQLSVLIIAFIFLAFYSSNAYEKSRDANPKYFLE